MRTLWSQPVLADSPNASGFLTVSKPSAPSNRRYSADGASTAMPLKGILKARTKVPEEVIGIANAKKSSISNHADQIKPRRRSSGWSSNWRDVFYEDVVGGSDDGDDNEDQESKQTNKGKGLFESSTEEANRTAYSTMNRTEENGIHRSAPQSELQEVKVRISQMMGQIQKLTEQNEKLMKLVK
ncbi:hypothetical protein HDU79_004235 [Rhizoclosmatium sp. JEL0117]|nr:hypothetical protein HDU79_004235 [Rhizoclosmatium sp. JEL0117]